MPNGNLPGLQKMNRYSGFTPAITERLWIISKARWSSLDSGSKHYLSRGGAGKRYPEVYENSRREAIIAYVILFYLKIVQ
jgi:hypothetical protein